MQFPKFLDICLTDLRQLRRHVTKPWHEISPGYRQGRGMPRGISKITLNMRLILQCRSPPIVTPQHRALGWPLFSDFSAKNSGLNHSGLISVFIEYPWASSRYFVRRYVNAA